MKIMFDKQKNICDKKIYESICCFVCQGICVILLYKFKIWETGGRDIGTRIGFGEIYGEELAREVAAIGTKVKEAILFTIGKPYGFSKLFQKHGNRWVRKGIQEKRILRARIPELFLSTGEFYYWFGRIGIFCPKGLAGNFYSGRSLGPGTKRKKDWIWGN